MTIDCWKPQNTSEYCMYNITFMSPAQYIRQIHSSTLLSASCLPQSTMHLKLPHNLLQDMKLCICYCFYHINFSGFSGTNSDCQCGIAQVHMSNSQLLPFNKSQLNLYKFFYKKRSRSPATLYFFFCYDYINSRGFTERQIMNNEQCGKEEDTKFT